MGNGAIGEKVYDDEGNHIGWKKAAMLHTMLLKIASKKVRSSDDDDDDDDAACTKKLKAQVKKNK